MRWKSDERGQVMREGMLREEQMLKWDGGRGIRDGEGGQIMREESC